MLAGHRVLFGDELIEGEGMADQDGVGLVGIERAVGLVGHPIGAEIDAAVEPERALGAQNRVAALGERLPFSLGQVVQLHGHCPLLKHERATKKPPTVKVGGFSQALRPFSED
jgi:hypothetical protein